MWTEVVRRGRGLGPEMRRLGVAYGRKRCGRGMGGGGIGRK